MNSKNNIPTVGIALLAYNYGRYVDEAIESLKQQTFQDFEVYLLDDGSTDGFTPNKLRSIKYDKIVSKVIDGNNLGNADRRRQQYKVMNNKYILDMSADDMLAPDFLEKTIKYMENHPKCGAVSTNIAKYMDDFKNGFLGEMKFDTKKMGLPAMLSECHCLGSSLMRNEALKDTDLSGGFKRYQDWDRWISMLEAGWEIGLVPEPLFKYRLHNKSLSHSSSAEIETDTFRKIIAKHKSLYQQYSTDVIISLFRNFQESGFYNKELSKQYVDLEKQNQTLLKKIHKIDSFLPNKIIRKVKTILRRIKK